MRSHDPGSGGSGCFVAVLVAAPEGRSSGSHVRDGDGAPTRSTTGAPTPPIRCSPIHRARVYTAPGVDLPFTGDDADHASRRRTSSSRPTATTAPAWSRTRATRATAAPASTPRSRSWRPTAVRWRSTTPPSPTPVPDERRQHLQHRRHARRRPGRPRLARVRAAGRRVRDDGPGDGDPADPGSRTPRRRPRRPTSTSTSASRATTPRRSDRPRGRSLRGGGRRDVQQSSSRRAPRCSR